MTMNSNIFYTGAEVFIVIVEIFIVHEYLKGIFDSRDISRAAHMCGFAFFGLALSFFSLFYPLPQILMVTTFAGTSLLALFLYDGTIFQKILASIIFCILTTLSEIICVGIEAGVTGGNLSLPSEYGLTRIVFAVISKLIQIILVRLIVSVVHKRNDGLVLSQVLPLLLCQILSMYLVDRVVLEELDQPMSAGLMICVVGILYINVIIFWYTEKIKDAYEMKGRKESAENQLEAQSKYYQDLEINQNTVKALWHDIQKHMSAMEKLVALNHKNEAAEYIENLNQAMQQVVPMIDTENQMVNVVLSECMQRARRSDIKIKPKIEIPKDIAVQPMDLAVIIGNTADNAISACEKITDSSVEKVIEIQLVKKEMLLFYTISNPYDSSIRPKSTDRAAFHGYGLQNVRKSVEAYGGHMNIRDDGTVYKVQIMLSLFPAK
jgi:hypothetical protein